MSESDSDSGDDDAPQALFTSMTAVGEPYCRFQGSYLPNLLKLLNESDYTQLGAVIRWHPKIANALQINWLEFGVGFEAVHPVLVQYKISRASNKRECVRPTMNRKLREWNFKMVSDGTPWVSYIYENARFNQGATHPDLPYARRRH